MVENNCWLCNDPDDDDMIQCDNRRCNSWCHHKCLGITEKQAREMEWLCKMCIRTKSVEKQSSQHVADSFLSFGNITSSTLVPATNTQTQDFSNDWSTTKQMDTVLETSPPRSVKRESSLTKSKEIDDLLARKLANIKLQKELAEAEGQIIQQALHNLTVEHEIQTSFEVKKDLQKHIDLETTWDSKHDARTMSPRAMIVNPDPVAFMTSQNEVNMRQWTARQSVGRELPTFTGKPEEWPAFIAAYEHSTFVCGFTDQENLIRLQKAIRGTARDYVESLLYSPNCVSRVISTLRRLFAQPEKLMNNYLEKFRKEPAPREDKPETFLQYASTIQNLWAVMNSSGMTHYLSNPLILRELIDKLPHSIKIKWAEYIDDRQYDMTTYMEWLDKYVDRICLVNPTLDLVAKNQNKGQERDKRARINAVTIKRKVECLACECNCEVLEKCKVFAAMSYDEKWNTLKSGGICKRCLRKHFIRRPYKCGNGPRCSEKDCKGGHHPLMHPPTVVTSDDMKKEPNESNHTHILEDDKLLFRYMLVKLRYGSKTIQVGAFLDEGSSGTFIDDELRRYLNANGPASILHIHYTNNQHYTENESRLVSLKISGMHNNAKEFDLRDVQTVTNLNLATQSLDYQQLAQRHAYLNSLPIESYQRVTPRLLIGLNNWNMCVPTKVKMGNPGEPIAVKCSLGWTIMAAGEYTKSQSVHYCNGTQHDTESNQQDEACQMMKHYYSLESLGVRAPPDDLASMEDRRALNVMKKTMVQHDKKYEIGLLWRHDDIKLPQSKQMALRRLHCLEARMRKDQILKNAVHQQMRDYIDKGYAQKLSPHEIEVQHPRKWYLPVFPVLNPNKPGKVRMVFDAAAEVNGTSLNSTLVKGPDQVPSLLDVLIRFRQGKIGVTGDIKEMFMQVKIKECDQLSQLFLYRENDTAEIDTYKLQVMTFGATCSPTCAQYIKNQNAEQFKSQYPRAVQSIIENHYVDDMLDSVDSTKEAIELIETVKMIHSNAGFEIRGWTSNSVEVMRAVGTTNDTNDMNMQIDANDQLEKVLGLWWCKSTDDFTYSLKFNKGNESVLVHHERPTKREMLRILMSLYDPLGLLTHFTGYLKVLLQDVWRSKITWDEKILPEHYDKWLLWINTLKTVDSIRIPRCYLKSIPVWRDAQVQLHIFVDASSDCSAAVAYLRIQAKSTIECSIVAAKSRVAPLKLISIPKLELIAALLGARLGRTIMNALKIELQNVTFWTDSETVLKWVRSDAKKLKGQFTQFKVAEIQDNTDIHDWRYIPSKLNVADDATKWTKKLKLNSADRWFHGPAFLYEDEEYWPADMQIKVDSTETVQIVQFMTKSSPVMNYQAFSRWNRLLRTVAYVCHFVEILKFRMLNITSDDKQSFQLDLEKAERLIIKWIQEETYPSEILALKSPTNSELSPVVSKASELYKLSPVLDNGLLRIRGRTSVVHEPSPYVQDLNHYEIPKYVSNPIILPATHYGTELLVRMYHEKYLHQHHETVCNEIRKMYYIPRLRQLLKKVRRHCPKCKFLNAQPIAPEMANLPQARLAPYTLPFTYTGVDCMGPMNVAIRRCQEKRWVVLFTCLTTRAIHLEIVNGMDHDSFILAYRCFIARRGEPREIYSDNGTNFVKAERILKKEAELHQMKQVAERLSSPTVKWHFNPPESPHMGGSWERLVKSVKDAFYSSIPTRTVSEPVLRSYMTEIEGILNSRPLTYVPLESENEEALTPNHFLLGTAGKVKPMGDFDDSAKLLRANWMMSQLHIRTFWKKWINEYLPELTRRSKWHTPAKPLQEGDLVLIIESNLMKNTWQRGRIVDVHKSKDGQVRSAIVKTATGLLTRPAVKLAKLDVVSDCKPESKLEDQITGGEDVAKGLDK